MHVILLCRVPGDHAAAALDAVAALPYPVALVMPHPIPVEHVPEFDPKRVEWVRTGYSEPWFPLLPDAEITRQLDREAVALSAHALNPGPLWVAGPWATRLPVSFASAGVDAVLLPADHLDMARPGVVAHLASVLPVLPVTTSDRLGDIDMNGDEAIVVEVAFSEIDAVAGRIMATAGCDLTTVAGFLAHHHVGGRRYPHIDDWEGRFESDPDRFILHRKLVRLVTRVPERLSPAAEQTVLEAERATPFSGGPVDAAHHAIVAARVAIDQEKRRGDDWWRISRLDWDADGQEEVHIELPTVSMVLAPNRSGSVLTFDLKKPIWPASSVAGEPGWVLARFTNDLAGLDAVPIELAVVRATELRGGRVEVEMAGIAGTGSLAIEVGASESRLDLGYSLMGSGAGRLGPELRLAFGHDIRVRVDGSSWTEVSAPIAFSGHKMRITDGEHQVVLTSLKPCSVFLRHGVEGTGLVVWPHWTNPGNDRYELTVDLTAPG